MAIGVGTVDVIVVVFPVTGAGVIWGVNIYAVHFACIGKGQSLEGMIILAIDDYLIRFVTTAFNAPGLLEPGIDWLIVFRHGDNVLNSYGPVLVVIFVIGNRFIWR